jgi:hypothetical protein
MKVLIEFDAAAAALRALTDLKALGYLDIESYAPFPLTDEEAHAPRGSFPLAALAFAGGLCALAAAYLIQWYANVESYPLNIGGRPAYAAIAFIPTCFESICLVATVAVFAGFLFCERLPRLWQPVFEIDEFERVTVDRFWVVLDVRGSPAVLDRVTADVVPLGPRRIIVSEDAA